MTAREPTPSTTTKVTKIAKDTNPIIGLLIFVAFVDFVVDVVVLRSRVSLPASQD